MNSLVINNPLYEAVKLERDRQDSKWGVQSHPSLPEGIKLGPNSDKNSRLCRSLGIPTQDQAQRECELRADRGELTWSHIAIEELSEAVCASTEEHRRDELIQLAAVCLAWAEDIDRKKKENGGE